MRRRTILSVGLLALALSAATAQSRPLKGMCGRYASAFNNYQAANHNPYVIVGELARPDGTGVWLCAYQVANLVTGKLGCYRLPVRDNLSTLGPPKHVDCRHPWRRSAPAA